MKSSETSLPGVVRIVPTVHRDQRGTFLEVWNEERYSRHGIPSRFVQDNVSTSRYGVLRGLHFQHPEGQGKLVSVLRGRVFDVVVDVRSDSASFGRWLGFELSDENGHQLYVPPGFAHGFVAISEVAIFAYKCTAPYRQESEKVVRWNDPDIGIQWPLERPLLSPKDESAPRLGEIPAASLPVTG